MDIPNTTNARLTPAQTDSRRTATAAPRWDAPSGTGFSASQCSGRKLYAMLALWAVVLGVAVASSLGAGGGAAEGGAAPGNLGENAFTPAPGRDDSTGEAGGGQAVQDDGGGVDLLRPVENSMPRSFADCQPNEISQPALLRPVARLLEEGRRPLRVLHIGDSHVAGRTFPLSLKATLVSYLGEASEDGTGHGISFSYIGRNGATNQHLQDASYLSQFAEKEPDLIIVSLGTNEAHGMGYREDAHVLQLDTFFAALREACPAAHFLITTPPGDYLSTSYVDYRRTARSRRRVRHVRTARRPNPMSAKCAACLADYGREHQIPVWDLFSICGGERSAQQNWVRGGYMRTDRIHFEPEGYELQGRLLGEALARALGSGK